MAAQNGESATLKKRKRDKHDEERKARKRHRAKSQGQADGGSEEAAMNDADNDPSEQLQMEAESHSELNYPELERYAPRDFGPTWKVSNPMGGRMLDIDPIFSRDEQHLIITYNTSIQVYSTVDSLLVRRIDLPLLSSGSDPEKTSAYIVSSVLSKSSPNCVWVACSDGRVWSIDWITGAGAETAYTLQARKVHDMTVELMRFGETEDDVLLILQRRRSNASAQIVAYDRQALAAAQGGTRLHKCSDGPQLLRSAVDGNVVVAATKEEVHVGLRITKPEEDTTSIADLKYQFYSFSVNDVIGCLDLRCSPRSGKKGNTHAPVVDLAVGCARGSIHLYTDILSKTMNAGSSVQPRKYHWHRKAVHSVKWSQDGNYLVSGGSETVLVLWQLDTGKRDFLPHLSASIENIVISPRGSSYALHLDDNSAMVLSTAEMKPTTYVSGIQSLVLSDKPPKDNMVRRVWNAAEEISTPLAATSHPTDPSQMLLCVGSGQQASIGEGSPSTPLVQAFDLASFQSISKHALARTMITENNITNQGHPIIEPRVTSIAFSHDGKWLASVDEWNPPERDMDLLADGVKTAEDASMERLEIHLKFWEVNSEFSSVELVTRVNEAHSTIRPERIFGLTCDPTSTRFATIGGDGAVRLWTPKLRKRDGLAVTGPEGQPLKAWSCSQTILLDESARQQDDQLADGVDGSQGGAVAFSEDGSVLFAAFGDPSDAMVYIIDTATGEIREKLGGLSRGDIRGMRVLSSCLVVLSEDLTVYDVVADELRYGFSLPDALGPASRLAQLAVNPKSQSFAVAVPLPKPTCKKPTQEQPEGSATSESELTIFSVNDNQPQLVQAFPRLITSLLPATGSTGFIAVDAAAQIWSIVEGTDHVPFVQPLTDMNLDDKQQQQQPEAMQTEDAVFMANGEDGALSDEEMQDGEQDEEEMGDDDAFPAVVAPQHLADIFNTAPSFAMPPIDDLFFRVTKLFSPQPNSARAAS